MSGICGIVFADCREAEANDAEPVLHKLEQRGPDGCRISVDGQAALGHALLATTPEAVGETLPHRHNETGCLVTADARLDNRADLIERLGVQDRGQGDGDLILRAYLEWGRACLDHLRGDFAFAIWDPRSRELFCARDQIGMRQLIWHHQPGRVFAFATEDRALLAHPAVPMEIDEGRIGDYFEGLEAKDLTSTFFLGLHKLPPAHALTYGADGVRTWRYWRAQPPEPLRLAGDADYAEAFLDVFTEAVETRLRSNGPVSAMLSGGMDSSSVAAVAARLLERQGAAPLATISAIRNDDHCTESNAIRAATGIDHIDPQLVELEAMEEYRAELLRLTRESREPFDGQMTLLRAVYLQANRNGSKVVLDGVGGDTTLASEPMVDWYFRQGRPLAAWREAVGERRFWGADADKWSDHARRFARTLAPDGWIARRQESYALRKLERAARNSILDPDFAARIDMAGRRQESAAHLAEPPAPADRKIHRVLHPHIVIARERYDRTASALAIEPRDPFLDLRVIEFCLSLPQEQLQSGGWPKIVLRQAMAGLVPDDVRWRRGKQHLGWAFTKSLCEGAICRAPAKKIEEVQRFLKPGAVPEPDDPCASETAFAERLPIDYLAWWSNYVNTCNF